METIGLVGIGAGSRLLGPVEAFAVSIRIQNHWAVQTMKAFGSLLAGKRKIKDSMTGPLGIVYLTSEAASLGAGPLLILLSLFSLSLAIFNCSHFRWRALAVSGSGKAARPAGQHRGAGARGHGGLGASGHAGTCGFRQRHPALLVSEAVKRT
jgi:hypothetical protein